MSIWWYLWFSEMFIKSHIFWPKMQKVRKYGPRHNWDRENSKPFSWSLSKMIMCVHREFLQKLYFIFYFQRRRRFSIFTRWIVEISIMSPTLKIWRANIWEECFAPLRLSLIKTFPNHWWSQMSIWWHFVIFRNCRQKSHLLTQNAKSVKMSTLQN